MAWLKHHPNPAFWSQGHHELRLHSLLSELEIVSATDQSQQEWPFQRREMDSHAGARSCTERKIGISGSWALAVQPALRQKLFGVGPKSRVSVKIVCAD